MHHANWTCVHSLLQVRGRLVIMATALAFALASAPGVSAAPKVPSGFVGVIADGPLLTDPDVDYEAQLDTMVGSGVQTLRTAFNWSGVQPYGSFADVPPGMEDRFQDVNGVPTDYTETDRLGSTAAARRIHVLPVLMSAPGWASRSPGFTRAAPSNFDAYAAYAADLVERYGPDGSFWSEHPELPRIPIRRWQIWNEPNLRSFWPDQPWAPDYVRMLQLAHDAIHRADPRAKVVLAGLPNQSWKALGKIYAEGGRHA